MALDDFMDIDSGESGSSSGSSSGSTQSTDKGSNLTDRPNFQRTPDGSVRRTGALGFSSIESFDDTKKGDFATEELNAKFWFPMFTHILPEKAYEVGNRYTLKVYKDEEHSKVRHMTGISCYDVTETQLNRIPREVVMLDTGEHEKEAVLDVLTERFGHTVEPTDTVFIHHFSDYISLAQTAIVSSNMNKVNNRTIDYINESALHRDRLKFLDEYDEGPSHNEIKPW